MSRRRFLVGYDIADDKRLQRMGKAMKGWGYRIQYSIFLCDLNGRELVSMRQDLRSLMHGQEDSVFILDLGEVDRWSPERFQVLGVDKDEQPDEPLVF
jgi:CRISPR-associated protein Cas2